MSTENRLTPDELAALAPGDAVVIESGADFGRRRHASGTVLRVDGPDIVVSCCSARGVRYVEHYRRRDGVRAGRGTRAELVDLDAMQSVTAEQRRQVLHVDALSREWTRNRDDVERLRRLHDAVVVLLQERVAGELTGGT